MNKKLYSLMALGTFLFAVACSDNDSPISGSTSVPNMGNNLNVPQSPVLCSVMGVTDSLEALEKGCIWSPEMWGPTTGYRVRTGYDNGTNTSGIWTVSTYPENANVIIEWPGNATTEYDSMALADVIDKCGGSLCGKVLFKGKNSIPENEYHPNSSRDVYFDFYLAGKNASGKFESVDARDMEGICVSHSGEFFSLELIPDDSIAALMFPAFYDAQLGIFGSVSKTDSNVKELCYSRNYFGLNVSNGWNPGIAFPTLDEVWAHLKGFRFVLSGSYGVYDREEEFKIIGISRYNTPRVSTDNLHPVRTDCEPVFITSSFCECDYSDEKVDITKGNRVYNRFLTKYQDLREGDASLSDSAKVCFSSTSEELLDYFNKLPITMPEKPCDNPLPQEIMCADGTTSESIEFTEVKTEFDDKVSGQDAVAIADSLFNHCLSL